MYVKKLSKRTKNIFNPESKEPFKLSRSRLDNFIRCQRCFYLDRRLGVEQPPGYPFNLNSAVDHLLKKEFDIHRANGNPHPLMKYYGIGAVPFQHEDLGIWRDNFKGVSFYHAPTNFTFSGAVDDIWVNKKGELHVVDYKATSKDAEVTLDADWQDGYKRQIEIYQWLLRANGFNVSDTGYFVYCNGKRDREAFDGKLEFDIKIISYEGKADWIEKALFDAKECLTGELPPLNLECEYCVYRHQAMEIES